MSYKNYWYDKKKKKYILEDENGNIFIKNNPLVVFVEEKDKDKLRDQVEYQNTSLINKGYNKTLKYKVIKDKYKSIHGDKLIGVMLLTHIPYYYNVIIKRLKMNGVKRLYQTNTVRDGLNLKEDFKIENRTIFFIDIETLMTYDDKNTVWKHENPLISIQIYVNTDNTYYVLYVDDKKKDDDPEVFSIKHKYYDDIHPEQNKIGVKVKNEFELLKKFLDLLHHYKPSMITGWFSMFYDVPYLVKRLELYNLLNQFTIYDPVLMHKYFGDITYNNRYFDPKMKFDKHNKFYASLYGINLIDYKDLYEKYIYVKPPSWKLDSIQKLNGIEGKTEYKGFNYYEENKSKFIEYSIRDVEILVKLDQKLSLIGLINSFENIVHVPLEILQYNTLVIIDYLTQNHIKEGKLMLSERFDIETNNKYVGQYVFDQKNEMFKNVMVFDFKSLYPNIVRTFNISNETLMFDKIDKLIPHVDVNGIQSEEDRFNKKLYYRLDYKGVIPQMIDDIITKRFKYKDEYKKTKSVEQYNKQLNYKILQNSIYGQLAFYRFSMYNKYNQSMITAIGRYIIKSAQDYIENELNKELEKEDSDIVKVLPIYGDSVSKDSEIVIKDKDGNIRFINIEELFVEDKKYTVDGKEYNNLEGIYTPSLNMKTDKVEWMPIKYVMRHKIDSKKKKMYRVWIDDSQYVDVTEDHSLIGYNNVNKRKDGKKYCEITPKELLKERHSLIYLDDEKTFNFNKKDFEKIEEIQYNNYVFDIEVDNNHTFFANNILVHNTDSIFCYIQYKNEDQITEEKITKDSSYILNQYINPQIVRIVNTLYRVNNDSEHPEVTLEMDIDKMFKKVRFFGVKKRYYGVDYDDSEVYKGIELVRSDTPIGVKPLISIQFRKQLFNEMDMNTLQSIYEEIKSKDLDELYISKSIGNQNFDNYKILPNHIRQLKLQSYLKIMEKNQKLTDNLQIYPVKIDVSKIDEETKNYIKNLFSIKRKKISEFKVNIQVVVDKINDLKEFLRKNDWIKIDYVEYMHKQVLKKIEQFDEYQPLIQEFFQKLTAMESSQSVLNIFG